MCLVRGAEDDSECEEEADAQMEVLHIVFPFDKLSRKGKLVCWGLCGLGWQLGHVHF
jgi:hypothetical protein